MSTEFREIVSKINHTVFHGISDLIEPVSPGYKRANKWFKRNHVSRYINLTLTSAAIAACGATASTPPPTEAPPGDPRFTQTVVPTEIPHSVLNTLNLASIPEVLRASENYEQSALNDSRLNCNENVETAVFNGTDAIIRCIGEDREPHFYADQANAPGIIELVEQPLIDPDTETQSGYELTRPISSEGAVLNVAPVMRVDFSDVVTDNKAKESALIVQYFPFNATSAELHKVPLVTTNPANDFFQQANYLLPAPTVVVETASGNVTVTPTPDAPPANPGFIEGVGNITSVTKRESDNRWYGVNELGMAVTFQNEKGEWVPYERPMKLAQYGGVTDPLITKESLGLIDIKSDDVTRLMGGILNIDFPWVTKPSADELEKRHDEVLPFGVVLEEKPYENRTDRPEMKDLTHAWISGINRGTITTQIDNQQTTSPGDKITLTFQIFEVPLQFESQILLIYLPDQQNINDGVFLIPSSGNVQDAKWVGMTDHDKMKAVSTKESVGKQMVIALQINNQPGSSGYSYNDAYNQIINALKNNSATDVVFDAKTSSRIIIPSP